MVHSRTALPVGHGEILAEPPVETWASHAEENAAALAGVDTLIGGLPLARLRHAARRQALAEAAAYSRDMGLDTDELDVDPALLFVTGHQPELFHPGVWAKYFLLDRVASAAGGVGLDLVVDTDEYTFVGLSAPCVAPRVCRERIPLAQHADSRVYALSPVPDPAAVDSFCAKGSEVLASLQASSPGRHFETFCTRLREQLPGATDLADLLTRTRRAYESPAGTRYLELPVSRLAGTDSFHRFAAHILLDAPRFAAVHNDELESFRAATGTRSNAQPFPNLTEGDGWVEAPFWHLDEAGRVAVFAREVGGRIEVRAGDDVILSSEATPDAVTAALGDSGALVPRALTLTLFARVLLGDLFIHGVGGGRYDRVTDAVIEAYFGMPAPRYAVASMTMYLPLGARLVTEGEVAEVRGKLHRLEHNPDDLLDEVEFDAEAERDAAVRLAAEKSRLVVEIKAADADKKEIGLRIRAVNAELAAILAPLAGELTRELAHLEELREASEVLTDRTYPYCLWSPLDVQDKVL